MMIVCRLKSLLPFLDVTVCNMAGSAQGHQIFYGVSELASTHSSGLYVVNVNGSTSTHLTGNPRVCVVTKCLQIDLCMVLHFW